MNQCSVISHVDLGVAEGPVWMDDGSIVVTSVDHGTLHRISTDGCHVRTLARTGGGPNGATPALGGRLVVTQNGGFDFRALGFPNAPEPDRVEPGIQLVSEREVTTISAGGLQSPNDLVVRRDGTLVFTDPPRYPFDPADRAGRVWTLSPDGQLSAFATGFGFCNGIALDIDETVLVVEQHGIVRTDGTDQEWLIEQVGPGRESRADGMCLDVQGRLYVAVPHDGGVRIFEDGHAVEFLPVPGVTWVTNCCFGGHDGRTLFATTGFPGRVVAWEGLPSAGREIHAWGSAG